MKYSAGGVCFLFGAILSVAIAVGLLRQQVERLEAKVDAIHKAVVGSRP